MNEPPLSAKQEVIRFIKEVIEMTNADKETNQPEISSALNSKASKLLSWLEGFEAGIQFNDKKKTH